MQTEISDSSKENSETTTHLQVIRNPKDPADFFETSLTEEEAVNICKELKSNFANSLAKQYPKLSSVQKFWLMKLASEEKDEKYTQLYSNLEEFCSKFPRLVFKVGELQVENELKMLGTVRIYTNSNKICVMSGDRKVGELRKDRFYYFQKCPEVIKIQLQVFAADPVSFLEYFGKATGHCCICGRLLTNEGSVARGIGPVCAEYYGI